MTELAQQIAEAKAKVAEGSRLVQVCQKRVAKFKAKFAKAAKMVKRSSKKPKKRRFWKLRKARNKQKVRFWTAREADALEFVHDWKSALARRLRKKAASQPNGAKLVAEALKYVGTKEGTTLQKSWAEKLGVPWQWPWCSTFVANMLMQAGILTKSKLPGDAPYSGSWIAWALRTGLGKRVNRSEIQIGDLLIFDWGDGGQTDHIAIYAGNGLKIGGNENDRVEHDAVPWGNVVAIIRVTA